MRLSSLSVAVAVAVIGLSTAQAAGPVTDVGAPTLTARAKSLGFDQVSVGPDGRSDTMTLSYK